MSNRPKMEMETYLTWDWKQEPVSPAETCEDTVLFDDSSTAEDLTAFHLPSSIVKDEAKHRAENKAEVVSKLLDDLNSLDNLEDLIKEEHFSNWLEEKVDLPIFEDIPIEPIQYTVRYKHEEAKPTVYSQVVPQQHQQQTIQDTNLLLREFETVFDAVELTHGQLTPPQSPPRTETQILTSLTPLIIEQQIVQPLYFSAPPERLVPIPVDLQPGTPQPDVARELAVVEELVRSRAKNLVDWNDDISGTTTEPQSPSSSSTSGFSEYSSDPEWIPEPVQSNSYVEKSTRGRKRAAKPYSRAGPSDKKSRKKEQNKNAATRYRQKKKAEVEEILTEERALMQSNDDLQTKVTDVQREIKYLKGLMRDLFKAKGLIK